MTVTKRVAKNTVTDSGGYEDVAQRVFLLSNTEVGLANENNIAEGSIYELFRTASNRIAYPTAEAVTKSEYKNDSLAAGKPWWWWLRTPNASNSCNARSVYTDGTLGGHGAYGGAVAFAPLVSYPLLSLYLTQPIQMGRIQ